jgi:TonB family protein
MKNSKENVMTEVAAPNTAKKLSTLDVAAMHTPSRFSVAISSSILIHALFFGLWASKSIINPPEVLEIQEVSFTDENEEKPAEKAPKAELGRGNDPVNAPTTAQTPPAPAESQPAAPPPASNPAGSAEESAEAVEAAENAKVNELLSVFDDVSEGAAKSGGVALNLPTAGTKLSSGRSKSNKDDAANGALSGSSTGGADVISSIVNEVSNKSPRVGLAKTGRVSVGGIGSKTGSPEGLGARTEESLRAVLNKYMGRLQYIYNKHLKLAPEIGGKVEVEVTINADGSVGNASILSSEIAISQFQQEITDAIRHWKYDAIAQGQVKVVYPIVFIKMN